MPTLSKHTRRDAIRWSDEGLAEAIKNSGNWSAVARDLGYSPTSNESRRIMKARAEELGLSTTHFKYTPRPPEERKSVVVSLKTAKPEADTDIKPSKRRQTWTDDDLRKAVAGATTWSSVGDALGLAGKSGKTISRLKKRAEELGIDIKHPTPPPPQAPPPPPAPLNRRWTDDDLEIAVAGATSWRAVARELGYPSKSGSGQTIQTLKAKAEELRLDTTHFTGSRRWSDAQITTAIIGSSTWREVTAALDARNTSAARTAVTINARRLSLELDHLGSATTAHTVDAEGKKKYLRDAATTIASAWFTLRGFTPSLPMEAKPYDLLIDMHRKIQRVQIKTCMSSSGQVTVAPRASGAHYGPRIAYSPKDVDLFFILDGSLSIYLIPIAEIQGKQAINLSSYKKFKVGSASSLIN